MKPFLQILMTWVILTCIVRSPAVAQVQAPTPVVQSSGVSSNFVIATGRTTQEDNDNILIPGTNADPNAMSNLAADLLVMCRIFDKTIQRTKEQELFPDMYNPNFGPFNFLGPKGVLNRFLNPQDSKTKALYVQGYGAVFTINVRFPLKASVESKTEAPIAKQTDPFWAETRQEIFEPHRTKENQNGPSYQSESVDRLKQQIKETLRYAANIRGIELAEYITVVVHGTERPADGPGFSMATLTLRTQKGDVDARATGGLDANAFDRKIQVIEF